MYRLLEFLRSIYIFLLFIVLESVSIYLYVNSNSYTQAKMLVYTASVNSSVTAVTSSVGDYFRLRHENDQLLSRIAELEHIMARYERFRRDSLLSLIRIDEAAGVTYMPSRVVSSSIHRQRNYMVINSGLQDGVRSGMAVVTPLREMVGVVVECSDYYSVVMSVLNVDFRTSGELDGEDDHAASIYWGGTDRYSLRMEELSKYAAIEVGAKVVTTGFSQIFPSGVLIGSVSDFSLDKEGRTYSATIEIAADPSALREVLVVSYMTNIGALELLESDYFN